MAHLRWLAGIPRRTGRLSTNTRWSHQAGRAVCQRGPFFRHGLELLVQLGYHSSRGIECRLCSGELLGQEHQSQLVMDYHLPYHCRFHQLLGSRYDTLSFCPCSALNIVGDIGAYGEAEFCFASIKVLTIVGSSHFVLAHI